MAACDDISLRVNEGEIYGFLGLNGAGKTTLIRMLLGMIAPSNGSVRVFGEEVTPRFSKWNNIGYMVETPNAYPDLTVTENLRIYFKLRQLTDPSLLPRIIDELKLTRYQHTRAGQLSLGNKQRLGLAKGLMHRPKLLILDEPINGLDPAGIVEVRELLRSLAESGSTIFLSSHILGEMSKVAHRIGIIHNGKLIKEMTTHDLTGQLERKVLIRTNDNLRAIDIINNETYHAILNRNDEIELTDRSALDGPENLTQLLSEAGLPPKQIYLFTEDLETYFLRNIA